MNLRLDLWSSYENVYRRQVVKNILKLLIKSSPHYKKLFKMVNGPLILSIKKIVEPVSLLEGEGFPVRRPFPISELDQVVPFPLLDHLGPTEWGLREAIGVPDHPHHGFETVTYLLAGENEHKDFGGHFGRLCLGEIQ